MQKLGIFEVDLGKDDYEDVVELELDNIVPISNDLNKEFTEQPSAYAYIAMLAARAEAAWHDAKVLTKRIYAEVGKDIRHDLKANKSKITEGIVNQEILLSRGYQDAQDNESWMFEQHLIMRALTQAMAQRAQMLISFGAHLRAEGDQTDMLVRTTKDKLDKLTRKRKPKRAHFSGDDPDSEEYEVPFPPSSL